LEGLKKISKKTAMMAVLRAKNQSRKSPIQTTRLHVQHTYTSRNSYLGLGHLCTLEPSIASTSASSVPRSLYTWPWTNYSLSGYNFI